MAILEQGEAVDHEGEAEEVHVLTDVTDAVGSSEPHRVHQVTVDRLAAVATPIQARVVDRISWERNRRSGARESSNGFVCPATRAPGEGVMG
jgi:hypothetical protein